MVNNVFLNLITNQGQDVEKKTIYTSKVLLNQSINCLVMKEKNC